jgi:PAS domain S-box-containing protein
VGSLADVPGGGQAPRLLVGLVVLLSVAGFLWGTMAIGPTNVGDLAGWHLALAWVLTGACFAASGLAWVPWAMRRDLSGFYAMAVFPALTLLLAAHGLALWRALAALDPAAESRAEASWFVARVAIGVALAAPPAALLLESLAGGRRRFVRRAIKLGVAVLFTALALAAVLSVPANRAFATFPVQGSLAVFFLADALAGAWCNARRPSMLTSCVALAALPMLAAQMLSVNAAGAFGGEAIPALALAAVSVLTLSVGFVADAIDLSSRAAVRSYAIEIHELRGDRVRQTQELQRIDREFGAQVERAAQVQRNLRLLERAINRMSIGLTVTDPAGKIIYVNPADAAMHGYSIEELRGKPASLFAAGEIVVSDRPGGLELWSRERLNRTKDGRVFPVRLLSDVVTNDAGAVEAVVTLCEDVSSFRRAVDELDRRDRILSAVGLAVAQMIEDEDLESGIRKALSTLGAATDTDWVLFQPIDTSVGRSLGAIGWHRSGKSADEQAQRALENGPWSKKGELWAGQAEALSPDLRAQLSDSGTQSLAVVPVRAAGRMLGLLRFESVNPARPWSKIELEALGAAARTLGAALGRQQAEDALRESEREFREFVESASDLIASLDGEGRFLYMNPAACAALGYSLEEARQLNIAQVLGQPNPQLGAQQLAVAADAGPRPLEAILRSKAGGDIEVEGSISTRVDDGRVLASLAILRDVTERRRVERMKREFLAMVSHELRTPLTSMLGSLGLLRSGRLESRPDKVRELLEIAERNGERQLRLINDLLDLQRLEAGELRFTLAPAPLETIVEEAARGIAGLASTWRVQVVAAARESGVSLLTDRERLNQVLYNLLSNAIKFSPAGALVHLQARATSERVEFEVRDQGPGIPEEFRGRLFEKFAQADVPGRRGGGSGLGLSISKRLVEGLGGTIRIDSGPRSGTVVTVAFPRLGEARPPAR